MFVSHHQSVFLRCKFIHYRSAFSFNIRIFPYFQWVHSKQQVFEVILIITSFILAWGEAWFLDCRVIPQERHARRYFAGKSCDHFDICIYLFHNIFRCLAASTNERTTLTQPTILTEHERPPQSVTDFYSPLDTAHHSDEEEEEVS